jgi:DNA-binding NtrC family response regulator
VLVSHDAAIQKLRTRAEQLAQLGAPVLLLGESGKSKEVVARLIHKLSPRSESVFMRINCSGYAHDVLEHELFGHERAQPNGQSWRKEGKYDLCRRGTILLDELAAMPIRLQAKILPVLEQTQPMAS